MPLPKDLKKKARNTYSKRCPTGKRRYKDRATAYLEFERIRSLPGHRFKGEKKPVDFYRCDLCSGYHLTTKERNYGQEKGGQRAQQASKEHGGQGLAAPLEEELCQGRPEV